MIIQMNIDAYNQGTILGYRSKKGNIITYGYKPDGTRT